MTRESQGDRPFSRRHCLKVGTIPLLGLELPRLLANESANKSGSPARNIILVWLDGGPSTIDMWDLKPEAQASIRGEFKPIDTAAYGVSICEHLPRMAEQMGRCTLIRSVSHTIAEHAQGAEHVLTGNPISPALKYPSLGSIVSSQTAADATRPVPAYVDLSPTNLGRAGYLSAAHNPFVVDRFRNLRRQSQPEELFALPEGFTVSDLSRRRDLLKNLEQGFRRFEQTARAEEMSEFQRHALDILTAGKTRQALDVSQEAEETLRRYGRTPFGQSALAARRLVQAGVRFVTIGMSGWDTHTQNFLQLRSNLLALFDTALSALIEDLETQGLLKETIVYCVGEFNRTPHINEQGGRDHWARAMSVLVAGGGFKAGFIYGATDEEGLEPADGACSPADINTTILKQVGIGPDTKLKTRSGRPMALFRDGRVIEGLCS